MTREEGPADEDRPDEEDASDVADGEQQESDDAGSKLDIAGAYARLGIDQRIDWAGLKDKITFPTFDGFKHSFDLHERMHEIAKIAAPDPYPDHSFEIPDFTPDDSPQRTAHATEQLVDVMRDVHTVTADLVRLTNANLLLAKSQQQSARRAERFTKWTALLSLGVAIMSLLVSLTDRDSEQAETVPAVTITPAPAEATPVATPTPAPTTAVLTPAP